MPWSPPEVHPSDGFYTHVVDGPRTGGPGLLAPLGQALTAFTLQHEEGARVSLPTGANTLRVIDADRVQIRDLPRLSGVYKEAATMAAKYLERKGLAEIQSDRSITLTAAGRDALSDYRKRAARPRDKGLRASLNAILSEREVLAAASFLRQAVGEGPSPTSPRPNGSSPIRHGRRRGVRWCYTSGVGPTGPRRRDRGAATLSAHAL
ncbi:MAG: hypothetical protein WBG41_15705 [Acidimicrobiales bacterium]